MLCHLFTLKMDGVGCLSAVLYQQRILPEEGQGFQVPQGEPGLLGHQGILPASVSKNHSGLLFSPEALGPGFPWGTWGEKGRELSGWGLGHDEELKAQ